MTTGKTQPRRSRMKEIAVSAAAGLVILIVVSVLGLRFGAVGAPAAEALRVGRDAPGFTLPTSTGETLALSDLRGQKVWLTFWTTWCPPCRVEMPDLQKAYETQPRERYAYVAVNMGEDPKTVKGFLTEIGYTLPVALDATGAVSVEYQVRGLPTHVFVGEDGTVKEIFAGVMSDTEIQRRAERLW